MNTLVYSGSLWRPPIALCLLNLKVFWLKVIAGFQLSESLLLFANNNNSKNISTSVFEKPWNQSVIFLLCCLIEQDTKLHINVNRINEAIMNNKKVGLTTGAICST